MSKVSANNLVKKKLGLLLGDEDDWPSALEALAAKFLKPIKKDRKTYEFELERVRIHPFSLSAPTSYNLVIDRLAWWHTTPREWLKKAAMVNGTYLLNNPFTFQSMEKHTAYCVMLRVGSAHPRNLADSTQRRPGHREVSPHRRALSRFFRFAEDC